MLKGLFQEIPHVLANGVGRSLIPFRAFRCLLCSQDIDEASGEIVKLVARLDMAVERHGVELRQHVNRAQSRVKAVANGDID